MHSQRQRFEQLQRALDAALDAQSEMILRAVNVALHEVITHDGVVWGDARTLEAQCQGMAQLLVRRLGGGAPTLLRYFALRPLPNPAGDGGMRVESLRYECPICRARVDLTVGARGTCAVGHAPARLVAMVSDDD